MSYTRTGDVADDLRRAHDMVHGVTRSRMSGLGAGFGTGAPSSGPATPGLNTLLHPFSPDAPPSAAVMDSGILMLVGGGILAYLMLRKKK